MIKTALFLGALSATFQAAYGHYCFSHLIVNNTKDSNWTYVREVSAQTAGDNTDYGKVSPQLGADMVTSTNLTCGRLASNSAAKTKIATIVAGEPIAFGVSEYYGSTIFHQGPAMAYLSKAPNDDLENYHGDGDWFKIAYWGPSSNTTWSSYNAATLNFTIPKTTPPGKYLLRMEQYWPLKPATSIQWYVNCAQVEVVGSGGGTPTEFAKFPGTYKASDPGITLPSDMSYYQNLEKYTPPGPAVWKG
jgi:hypothetical protein